MQKEFNSLQNKFEALKKERDTLFPYSQDSDHDSVSDAIDKCLGTVNGAEVDSKGCEKDSDGDSVPDRLDLCPDTAGQGTTNLKGCPGDAPVILSGIYFSGGSTELSPASQTYMEKVYNVIQEQEGKHFEVGGYTDSIGDTDRNLTVSRQRAEAVTNYLTGKGIDPDRLIPMGYGPAKPVADNTTSEGRAANRRVELKIIPTPEQPPAKEAKPTEAAEEEGLPVQ